MENGGPTQLTPTASVRASSEKASKGAQYAGMGLDLLQYAIFESSLRASDRIFASLGAEWSLLDELKIRCLSFFITTTVFKSHGPPATFMPHIHTSLGDTHANLHFQMLCAARKTFIFPSSASHYAQRCKLLWWTYYAASASLLPR